MNPKIWWVRCLLVRIICIQKNSFDIKKRDNQTLYYEADIQSRTRFHHVRLWYWFINHTALISGYSCFTSQYEVQSVNRLATAWHCYCCHNLLPLVAHTVQCAESFPAWINTPITVLCRAVQVVFFPFTIWTYFIFVQWWTCHSKCSQYSVYSSFPWHFWCRKFVTTLQTTLFLGICILQKYWKLMFLVQQNTLPTSTNNLLCINYNTKEQPHHIPAHIIDLRLRWLTLPNKACIFPPSNVTDYRYTLWKQNTAQIKLK